MSETLRVAQSQDDRTAGEWDEFCNVYADWAKVSSHPAMDYTGASWAA